MHLTWPLSKNSKLPEGRSLSSHLLMLRVHQPKKYVPCCFYLCSLSFIYRQSFIYAFTHTLLNEKACMYSEHKHTHTTLHTCMHTHTDWRVCKAFLFNLNDDRDWVKLLWASAISSGGIELNNSIHICGVSQPGWVPWWRCKQNQAERVGCQFTHTHTHTHTHMYTERFPASPIEWKSYWFLVSGYIYLKRLLVASHRWEMIWLHTKSAHQRPKGKKEVNV